MSLVLASGYGGDSAKLIGAFSGMVLFAQDMRRTYEELRERGVQFTEAPSNQPWGMTQLQFVDPDANRFVLVGPIPTTQG